MIILETNDNPRPVPFTFDDTKGSNISSTIFKGIPLPLSIMSICSGKISVLFPETAYRTPELYDVRIFILPRSFLIDSQAFFKIF